MMQTPYFVGRFAGFYAIRRGRGCGYPGGTAVDFDIHRRVNQKLGGAANRRSILDLGGPASPERNQR